LLDVDSESSDTDADPDPDPDADAETFWRMDYIILSFILYTFKL
jgi:hypothetical protein